jgi:hypothetical protein
MKPSLRLSVALALTLMFSTFGNAQAIQASATRPAAANTHNDPVALGHPLSYWLKSIQNREPGYSEVAFEAIVQLGPEAEAAIPDLTKILEEPFEPIRVGTDSREDIREKLREIQFRGGAVDGLGAIGEAAALSTEAVIRWGLTIRVLAPSERATSTDALLVELIGIDVLERMRAAGAISRFGLNALEPVQRLIDSDDNENRKFAAAILSERTILVATQLMKGKGCTNRMLGLSLLSAMWPVVAREHLTALSEILRCSDEDIHKPMPADRRGMDLSSYRH